MKSWVGFNIFTMLHPPLFLNIVKTQGLIHWPFGSLPAVQFYDIISLPQRDHYSFSAQAPLFLHACPAWSKQPSLKSGLCTPTPSSCRHVWCVCFPLMLIAFPSQVGFLTVTCFRVTAGALPSRDHCGGIESRISLQSTLPGFLFKWVADTASPLHWEWLFCFAGAKDKRMHFPQKNDSCYYNPWKPEVFSLCV